MLATEAAPPSPRGVRRVVTIRRDTGAVTGHSHHANADLRVSPKAQKLLLIAVVPFVVATAIGLVWLWPGGTDVAVGAFRADEFRAVVDAVEPRTCADVPGQENFRCLRVTVELLEGEDEGDTFSFDYSTGPKTRAIREGDSVIVGRSDQPAAEPPSGTPAPAPYFFVDFDRRMPLLALGAVFAIVVVALSRWRGLAALAGVGISLLVLIKFVLPAILEGGDPLTVAIFGGAAIMFVALYLAHGFNAATTTAVLGTLASLLLTGLLALLFVEISIFTGVGSEEANFLQISQQQVNLEGLLLASIVIGTLGVLDDVTVTQASAVWELRRANPSYGVRDLYRSGIRIGRDHIASTVNTLVLAYAGASLPLLILFTVSGRGLSQVLNTEIVSEEIVRTLVGSIGLVASVPITTGLAAFVVTKTGDPDGTPRPSEPKEEDDDSFRLPKAEREWREES
ncbi:MAG: YibE/F family protein [Actinomycetota bacterium]